MRASRLIALISLLQARGRMSTAELAAELEVSPRTVLRDLDALSTAGIPVYAARGRNGGFALLEGFTGAGLPRRGGREPVPAGPPQRALIRISPRGRRLAALLGRPEGLRLRRQQPTAVPGRADWAEAWIRFGTVETAVLELLALGAEVEVLQPAEVRRALGETGRRVAGLNGDPV